MRLNRDERGGSLRELADVLEGELATGRRRLVLDNTYLTRADRSYVIEAAARHGLDARCVWLDTPLAQAQVNLVERLLERFGSLPTPEELRGAARREQGLLAPTSQMRALRALEPPSPDEGWAAVERVEFEREPGSGAAGVLVAAPALAQPAGVRRYARTARGAAPRVRLAPRRDRRDARPRRARAGLRGGGSRRGGRLPAPRRPAGLLVPPPLPGLPLAFARAHGIDLARSTLIGARPANRTLATTLGADYVQV